jgi:SAM-dependent methyltransferase
VEADPDLVARLERQEQALRELTEGVQNLSASAQHISSATERAERRVDGLLPGIEGAEQVTREIHARPTMFGDPFSVFDHQIAGRVMGYDETAPPAGFDEVFRGSEELIRERERTYLPLLGDGPVLDAGCGRGEVLDLLRELDIPCLGAEISEAMVARCREKGHEEVRLQGANECLESLEPGSLGTVFANQVIEHLDGCYLRRFLALAHSRLRPGGRLIVETVNPHSVQSMKAFWVDLTHHHPLFPEVVLLLCHEAGFGAAYAFHPNATGDVERDRFERGEYAVVATRSAEVSEGAAPA